MTGWLYAVLLNLLFLLGLVLSGLIIRPRPVVTGV